jgi:hypothetical protein
MTSIAPLSALYLPDEEAKSDFGFDTAAALSENYAQFAKLQARNLLVARQGLKNKCRDKWSYLTEELSIINEGIPWGYID